MELQKPKKASQKQGEKQLGEQCKITLLPGRGVVCARLCLCSKLPLLRASGVDELCCPYSSYENGCTRISLTQSNQRRYIGCPYSEQSECMCQAALTQKRGDVCYSEQTEIVYQAVPTQRNQNACIRLLQSELIRLDVLGCPDSEQSLCTRLPLLQSSKKRLRGCPNSE